MAGRDLNLPRQVNSFAQAWTAAAAELWTSSARVSGGLAARLSESIFPGVRNHKSRAEVTEALSDALLDLAGSLKRVTAAGAKILERSINRYFAERRP